MPYNKLLRLFYKNGYVLGLSKDEFRVLTKESIGIDLIEEYLNTNRIHLSAGKALSEFLTNGNDSDKRKLCKDLLNNLECSSVFRSLSKEEMHLYEHCRDKLNDDFNPFLDGYSSYEEFGDFLNSIKSKVRISLENENYDSVLTEAFSLLEYCLRKFAIDWAGYNKDKVNNLNRKRSLKILSDNIKSLTNDPVEQEALTNITEGIEKVVSGVATLRNARSDAHGHGFYTELPERTIAIFAFELSCTLAMFIIRYSLNKPVKHTSTTAFTAFETR